MFKGYSSFGELLCFLLRVKTRRELAFPIRYLLRGITCRTTLDYNHQKLNSSLYDTTKVGVLLFLVFYLPTTAFPAITDTALDVAVPVVHRVSETTPFRYEAVW